MENPQTPSPTPPRRCLFCEWEGGDVVEVPTDDGKKTLVCQSCFIIANIGVDNLGSAHPGVLIPVIRSCVAQAVGAIMGQFMEKMIQVLSACAEHGMSLSEKSAVIKSAAEEMKKDHGN